jgi:hypothetical protein
MKGREASNQARGKKKEDEVGRVKDEGWRMG